MIRVLIADDERVECLALERMVRENFPDTEVLPSVMDGVSLVKSVNELGPDVVIVDINMPLLSGLDALEILRAGNPRMEIMIHTAYSDFSFMRRAIQMGASDYLVKPVFVEDFIKAFRPLAEKAREKKGEGGKEEAAGPKEWQAVMEKNILMSCLLGKPDRESWQRYQRSAAGPLPEERLAFFCVSFSGGEKDLYYASFAEELKRRGPLLSVICRERLYCLLAGLEGQTAAEALRSFARRHDLEYRAGLGAWHEEWEELSGAPAEAEAALAGAPENSCGFFQAREGKSREDPFAALTEEAARFLLAGQGDRAKDLLFAPLSGEEAFFYQGFYAQYALSSIAALCRLELRRTGSRWALPTLAGALTQGAEAPWGGGEGAVRLQEGIPSRKLKSFLAGKLERMEEDLGAPLRQENSYVRQAQLYIRQHFPEDISLEQTADALGITQFYLSRLLKQELCQTFLELLSQERLTHVLLGLLDQSRSLQSVCTSAGYTQKYLYRVFRSSFGVTPKEFRGAMRE